jgi:peptidoglycan/LPS O-acetylase OafA/YrhL
LYWAAEVLKMMQRVDSDEAGLSWTEALQIPFLAKSWFVDDESWLWFVSTIAWLYVIFPLIAALLRFLKVPSNISRCVAVATFAYLAQVLIAIVLLDTPDADPKRSHKFERDLGVWTVSFYQFPPARAPEFLLGIVLAYTGKALQGSRARCLAICADLSFVTLLVLFIVPSLVYSPETVPRFLDYELRMDLASPLFFMLFLGMGFGGGRSVVASILEQPLSLALGELAYGFYVWHYFILSWDYFLDPDLPQRDCNVIAGRSNELCGPWTLTYRLAASLILAYVTYVLMERPVAEYWARGKKTAQPSANSKGAVNTVAEPPPGSDCVHV